MDSEERQAFTQDAFTTLDVAEANEQELGAAEEEVTPGFGQDSE
jgi:hypothetical protein